MKQEYKDLYEKFGLNVVFYRKKKKLTQLRLVSEIRETPAADLHFQGNRKSISDLLFYFSKPPNLPLKRLVLPFPMLYLVHKEQGTQT